MKYEDENIIVREIVRPQATVIQFPRNRIRRIILKTGKPYDPPGPRYVEWDQPA